MQQHRIATISQKLHLLGNDIATRGLIDVDLMLDYTRVLYADLLELRQSMAAQKAMHIQEPTLDELTEAMLAAEAAEDEALTKAADEADNWPEPAPATNTQASVAMPAPEPPAKPPVRPFQPQSDFSHKGPAMSAPVSKRLLFEDMIGINDRYLFQQDLFHNDHVLYHKAMEAINAAHSTEEVNDWLAQQVSGHRNWDLYSEAGSTFYAILNRYFEQK